MQKLKQNEIQFLAYHLSAYDKAYSTQIYFLFDTKENGEEGFDLLKRVYGDECNYDAWSGWFGVGDKRDFYLGFDGKEAREQVYNDIKNAIDSYKSSNQYDINDSTGDLTASGTSNTTTKTNDWTTYIVLGAAAAIIIALLWKKK